MNLPYHILLQAQMPAGKRLPKRSKPTYNGGYNIGSLPAHYQGRMGPSVMNPSLIHTAREAVQPGTEFRPFVVPPAMLMKGNLQHGDYRYWFGVRTPVSTFARCRCCYYGCMTVAQRKKHFEDGVCGRRITNAIKELDLGFCIVCEKAAHNQTWGITFCSDLCKTAFMFDDWRHFTLWELAKDTADAKIKC